MPFITRLPALTGADPYPDALLALDFVGARRGPQYYKALGVTTADITKIPGWTYTGGTAAGTGSYAARQDGSLQFFPSYTNLAIQSQTFDNAAWTKSSLTVTADQIAAPDGTTTADLFTSTGSNAVRVGLTAGITVVSGDIYTASAYLKAGNANGFVAMYSGGTVVYNKVDLSTGAVTLGGGGTRSGTATSVGNGWWRVTLTWTTSITDLRMAVGTWDGSADQFNYPGTSAAGKTVYAWGAQLELGSTASTYIPTTTAAVTVGTPRITDAGYWAEEARTNSIPNTSTTGAVVGVIDSGGALPTGWARIAVTGLTYTIVGTGTGSHGQYIDVRVSGTNSSGALAYPGVSFVGGTTVAASTGQTWSNSFYVALIAGSTSNVGTFLVNNVESTSGGAWVSSNGGTYTPTATVTRQTYTRTLDGGVTTAYVYLASTQTVAAGLAVDYTLRLSMPQLELGAFATSPIPTTSVAVTRAADVGYVSGLTFPVPSTALASFNLPYTLATSYRGIIGGGNGLPNITVGNGSSPVISTSIRNVQATSSTGNTYSADTVGTSAFRAQSGSSAVVLNGGTVAASAAAFTALTSGTIGVGYDNFSTNSWAQGPIRRIVIYPRAFANSELQAITTAGAY